jgi:hypothetical protein
MIPIKPQTLAELQTRYPECLHELYIQQDVARGIRVRPGTQRENVFDFHDKVRLIISKEQCADGRLVIHISGSIRDEGGKGRALNDTLIHHIIEHYALISGNMGSLEVIGITENQVIHFYCRLDN